MGTGPLLRRRARPPGPQLDDDALESKANKWIHAFLENEAGWIGPDQQASEQGYEYDPWPRFIVLEVLRQHYEATGDETALDAMLSFCRYLWSALEDDPLEE